MLKIGDFSKLSRISIRMLRHYDDMGLLRPKSTDAFTGYRYYSEEQLPVAARITALKDMGFKLGVIGEILQSCDTPEALMDLMCIKRAEMKAEAEDVSRRLLLLETAINRLRKDGTMHYNVTLKTMPEQYVASVRKVIPTYAQEGLLWEILMRETAPLHMQDGEPAYALAMFHDGEHKEADVDVEVQKSVRGNYRDTQQVRFKTVPPVEIASATYKGGYEKMTEVNQAVAGWVQDNGYEFNGPAFNIYHVSPYETQDPEAFVTEVCYPVKKK